MRREHIVSKLSNNVKKIYIYEIPLAFQYIKIWVVCTWSMYGLTSTCPTRASASRVLSMVAYVLRQCRTMTTLDVCRPWISTLSRDCCSMEVIPAIRCEYTTRIMKILQQSTFQSKWIMIIRGKTRKKYVFALFCPLPEGQRGWLCLSIITKLKDWQKSSKTNKLSDKHLQVWLCPGGACLCSVQRGTAAGWIL